MRTYRCQCGNLKLLKEGEERYPPSGAREGGEDENGRSPVVVVRGGKVEILFPSLSKNYVNGITRCLICNVNVYRAIDGDKTVEVLVQEGEGAEGDQESPAFSPSLGLLVPSASSSSSTFSPSRPRRFPSPPALPTSYAPPTTLLQTAPEPFFLPHPFSPNHPAFHSITLKVEDHLRLERQRLVDEIASFLDAKRDQFEALSDKTRKDVEEVWKIFEDGQREREEEERLGGPNGAGGGGEMDKVVEGVATPIKTTERFPKELEMSSSISSLPRPTSSTSVGSYKAGFILPPSSSNSSSALASPTLPRHPSTILSPTSSTNIPPPTSIPTTTTTTAGPTSLLSASLSRGSYLLSRPPAYYDDRPRPALDPIPSPPLPSGFTHHPSPPRIETDLDLASSMIASTWQEPANLIFRSNKHHPMPPPPKRKGSHQHEHPETVREEREEAGISRIGGAALGEGAVSASFKEREERMGEQPVAKTPPQSGGHGSNGGGGEQEIGFIEEEERRRAGLDRRNAKEGKEVGGTKGKQREKEGKSPKRKVTFLEPTTSAELEEEGEYEPGEEGGEAILDGNHEEVFDFEEPELPSSSPSPSPLPIDETSTPLPPFTLLRSTSSSSTTATLANLASTSAPSSSNDVLPDSQADARPSRSIEKDEPMYTLDGRSALRPVPTAKSHSRSPSADRRTEAEKELQGENNRVLVSMKKLTAADLPSHRAAWKDKPRDWQIFGRFGGRPGGGRSVSSSSDDGADEEPPSVHYGQSLPVNILPPPGGSTTSSSKPPLEHKTSYTDEPGALVPPLRAATRRVSTTIATNRSSSHSSSSGDLVRRTSSSSGTRRTSTSNSRSMPATAPAMDPGPGLVEDEEDSESTTGAGDSGFVPPHLRGRTTEEEEGVLGWASSVVG